MSIPLFTPRSARRALEAVVPAAESLSRLVRRLESRSPRPVLPDTPVEAAYFRDLLRVCRLSGALRSAGIRIADPAAGILEFPARRDGRAVWLRFRLGDRDLAGWRSEGAAQPGPVHPLDEEGPWEDPDRGGTV